MSEEHEHHRNLCDNHFERNHYYFGKLMKAEDFKIEQSYFNEKRWLINRMIHGWGVVCGLDVEPTGNPNEVRIMPGLAIDCCGREILVCEPETISLIPKPTECSSEMDMQHTHDHKRYAICLKYKARKTEPFPIYGACDQEEKCQYNRIKDSFEIKIITFSTPEWKKPFCPKGYGCRNDNGPHHHCMSLHECICRQLCDHDFCKHNFSECHENSCIVLATYTRDNNSGIEYVQQFDTSDEKMVEKFNKYSHRRLIYNNSLLYDLISCYHGDLPRVCEISWEHAKTSYDWHDFRDVVVPNGLKVTFNKPMNFATINQHTFQVATITIEEKTGYRLHRYIPGKIKPSHEESFNDVVNVVTFEFDPGWIGDEVGMRDVQNSAAYSGIAHGANFEIILRGCSIFSKDGKALDGCFTGDLPSGTGTQGTDFISWFSLHRRGGHKIKAPEGEEEEEVLI